MNNALLRFHYGGTPEKWDDNKYYKMICEMEFVFEYMALHSKRKLGI